MNRYISFLVIFLAGISVASARSNKVPVFKKLQLSDKFWCEGANYGDFNRDGKMDVASGPFWYEGPKFTNCHEFYDATASFTKKDANGAEITIPGFEGALGEKNAYSSHFFTYTYDFNGDHWIDILVLGFPGKESWWFENPKGKEGHWTRHTAFEVTDNESPSFGDVTGDGKPELICCSRGFMGYAEPNWKNPDQLWTFHAATPDKKYNRFAHGIGFGDVNGDGHTDLLDKDGWWEQPQSLQGDPVWAFHEFPFAPKGSAQMLVYDVNGDRLADVITCLWAHGYGLVWYEQLARKSKDEPVKFEQHIILNPDATPNKYGVSFTQPHALDLIDINGDGLKDIVTGKRFWAHGKNGPDPESNAPAVLYWFELSRSKANKVVTADFIPHKIDDDSGVGTEVVAGDVNGDKRPDIVVGNKKGTFVFLQE